MAWIGIFDTKTLVVQPVCSFGDEHEYLKAVSISADAYSPFGGSQTDTAIRENHPFWCQDFLNDPATTLWHASASHSGFAASGSLPLHNEGVVVGAFTLYSGEVNSFDDFARDLLVEMAKDIK